MLRYDKCMTVCAKKLRNFKKKKISKVVLVQKSSPD
jgi:hypothetical protein